MVLVNCTQWAADGEVERMISVDGYDLTVEQARQLAAALTAAVDEVERMNGYDRVIAPLSPSSCSSSPSSPASG